MRNKIVAVVLASTWVLVVPAAHAQSSASKDSPTVTDQDIQLLRQDLRSGKNSWLRRI